MTKKCFKCKDEKLIAEFYAHPKMADGYLNKCISCTKKDTENRINKLKADPDYNFIEKERKRGRQKYHRLYEGTGKAKIESNIKHILKYPEKRAALNMSAELKKPFDNAEKHHWSYNEEHFKDVIWLTKRHHMKAHRFIVYDPERKMYRSYDTNELLETKERHENFIFFCIENKED